MREKLSLDRAKIALARKYAASVARHTQDFVNMHTTVAVERTVCRLLGIDGADPAGIPLANVVVSRMSEKRLLPMGAALIVGNAMVKLGLSPQQVAEKINAEGLDICALPMGDVGEIKAAIGSVAEQTVER
jgi:beta-lysine 5,6-aminomutase alpha subunit